MISIGVSISVNKISVIQRRNAFITVRNSPNEIITRGREMSDKIGRATALRIPRTNPTAIHPMMRPVVSPPMLEYI